MQIFKLTFSCIKYPELLKPQPDAAQKPPDFQIEFYCVAELFVVFILGVLTFNLATIITAPIVSIGFSYIVFSSGLLGTHLSLTANHLTQKEFQ